MNIFVFDKDSEICAQMHDDVRLRKMIVEYAQILSTVTGVGYKPTHLNHPCVLWSYDAANLAWLFRLWVNCNIEYCYRFGKIHKSFGLYEELSKKLFKDYFIRQFSFDVDRFVIVIKNEFGRPSCRMYSQRDIGGWAVCSADIATVAYREYFNNNKQTDINGKLIAKWTKRAEPEWFIRKESFKN